MSDPISGTEGVSGGGKAQFIAGIKQLVGAKIRQLTSVFTMREQAEPAKYASRSTFKELKERQREEKRQEVRSEKSEKPAPEKSSDTARVNAIAKFYQKRNAEMDSQKLLTLYTQIENLENVQEMLDKVLKHFSDPSLADEALDFLLETLPPGSAAYKKALETKNLIRAQRGRQIIAGRNMGDLSRSHPALGTPSELRDLYREIIGNPREAQSLFEELIQQFTYEKMQEAIAFVLQSLRADLTAKGSSISHGQLHTLISEARNMQAILGVYRFFKGRSRVLRQQFEAAEMAVPYQLDFESLAKILVIFIKERYPSADKILRLAVPLGITDDELAQIIVFSQYRDAMRGISPRFFQSEKHRQEMLMTFIEALAELEDALEEEEDE